jgi:hypothetical protein
MSDPTFEFHPEALMEAWEARRWYTERNRLRSRSVEIRQSRRALRLTYVTLDGRRRESHFLQMPITNHRNRDSATVLPVML